MRLHLLPILALMWLPLIMAGGACSSSDEPTSDRTAWDSMIAFPPSEVVDYVSVEELEESARFNLVLPSWLPGWEGGYMARWKPRTEDDDQSFYASVVVRPPASKPNAPEIEIDEWSPGAWESESNDAVLLWGEDSLFGDESETVGRITVLCEVRPRSWVWSPPQGLPITPVAPEGETHPHLVCRWEAENLHIQASFAWTVSQALPSVITGEMREEAMKVVRSMIEDPYSP